MGVQTQRTPPHRWIPLQQAAEIQNKLTASEQPIPEDERWRYELFVSKAKPDMAAVMVIDQQGHLIGYWHD